MTRTDTFFSFLRDGCGGRVYEKLELVMKRGGGSKKMSVKYGGYT